MNTPSLAARNLLRNRRRSATTLLAMVVGACAVLLFGGYIRDINYGLQTGYVMGSGHLQLQHRDYFLFGTGNPAAYGIAGYQRIVALLRADPVLAPMTRVVTPSLQLGALAGNFAAGVSRTVSATGLVVEEQNRMRSWNDYALRGTRYPLGLTGSGPDAVVVGVGVARVLQLCAALQVQDCPRPQPRKAEAGAPLPADIAALQGMEPAPARTPGRIEMLAANAHGAPNVASVQVVKAEPQGVKALDDIAVTMHLAQAQRLVYGGEAPQVTAIALQLQHTAQMPAARARLEALLSGPLRDDDLEILDFATLNPFYGQTMTMFDTVFGFIALLIGAIVLFTVGNTMSAAVMERTVEIGTLRAMGLARGGIQWLFLCESLLLGIAGAAVGVLCAAGIAAAVNAWGVTWVPPGWSRPAPLSIRVWGEPRMMIGCAVELLVVALLSAWWPARRAARMNIVDALRHA